jgi:cyclohexa-1,5-dienecarbonyl-CoA hydratase
MPVTVAFNRQQTRARFHVSHPKGNILTLETIRALRAGLETIGDHPHLRLVSLHGEGEDFSFGASIQEHQKEQIATALPEMHALILDLLELPAPTAAVVRGRCLGGGFEIALACDVILASEDSVFGLPEITLGVFPPAACVLLPARAGLGRAIEAILTGELEPASAWAERGVVRVIGPSHQLEVRVDEWFDRHLSVKSAAALRHACVASRHALLHQVRAALPELERLYLTELMRTHDASEGVEAFIAKRTPDWQDR